MAGKTGFWIPEAPLILASRSAGRSMLLQASGIPIEIRPADIDERKIEEEARAAGASASDVARRLACEKARVIAAQMPDSIVLGCDQVLEADDRIFSKPADRGTAAEQLRLLSGRRHGLHSAACLMRGAEVLAAPVATAWLTMRHLSEEFIAHYLDAAGPQALASVGAYQIEGLGVHLFENVEGDQPTIVGLPLYSLLEALRRADLVRG